MRYFKNVETEEIFVFASHEIEKEYNVYGLLINRGEQLEESDFDDGPNKLSSYIDYEYLQSHLSFSNSALYKDIETDDVREKFTSILDRFLEIHELTVDEDGNIWVNSDQKKQLIELSAYTDAEEDYVDGDEDIYKIDPDLNISLAGKAEELLSETPTHYVEYVNYYDGSNWRKFSLPNEFMDNAMEEITDDMQGYQENKIALNSDSRDSSALEFYAFLKDNNVQIYKEDWTSFASSPDPIKLVEDSAEMAFAFIGQDSIVNNNPLLLQFRENMLSDLNGEYKSYLQGGEIVWHDDCLAVKLNNSLHRVEPEWDSVGEFNFPVEASLDKPIEEAISEID
ncbi:MAG: hypothetical protein ACOC4D_00050 [Bacteroidota bacterium]